MRMTQQRKELQHQTQKSFYTETLQSASDLKEDGTLLFELGSGSAMSQREEMDLAESWQRVTLNRQVGDSNLKEKTLPYHMDDHLLLLPSHMLL